MSNTKEFTKVSGMIVYCNMYEAKKAFIKPGAPKKPNEWDCSIVLTDEDTVDDLEAYGKSLDTMLSIKKVKTTEFKDAYKVDPPEGAGKNVWIFKLKKSTEQGKTGRKIPFKFYPQVLQNTPEGRMRLNDIWKEVVDTDEDGNEIRKVVQTNKQPVLVGNGSFGTISIDRFDRSAGGATLSLKNLLVTELKAYVGSGASNDGNEFDDDSASDGNGGTTRVPPSAKTKDVPKVKAKAKPQDDEDDSDSLPF